MIRNYEIYRKAQQAIDKSGLKITLYFGTDGIVKRRKQEKINGETIR